ncbi:MAG: hypothetical protein GC192_21475 [Bacteroidetes bacterium]|nr:hypothetical protein [Bacteroidota bacterium]
MKEFLVLEKAKSGSIESQAFWLSILKERGLKAALSRKAALLQRDLEAMPKTSIADYMNGMVSNYFYYYHLILDKQKTDITSLKNCGADMDIFYAVSRLKLACEMANRQNIMSLKFDLDAIPTVIEISKTQSTSHPLLELYQKVYELIAHNKYHFYPEVEGMLFKYVTEVDAEEIHIILSYLHNYAAAKIRQGDQTYWNIIHRLNVFGVSNGIFENDSHISSSQFNNIVSTACFMKEFVWASSFIKSHKHLLNQDIQKDAILLAESIIYFERKKYWDVIQTLNKSEFTDWHHAIRSKTLIMKSYYELQDKEGFDTEAFCLAFEGYLRRNRKSQRNTVEATLNSIAILKMLVRRKTAKSKIVDKIMTTNPLYLKNWLLEKANSYNELNN